MELSRDDKTQVMLVVGMGRVQAYQIREVTVVRREGTCKQFLTNNKEIPEVELLRREVVKVMVNWREFTVHQRREGTF